MRFIEFAWKVQFTTKDRYLLQEHSQRKLNVCLTVEYKFFQFCTSISNNQHDFRVQAVRVTLILQGKI